jgi:hypothetical protein
VTEAAFRGRPKDCESLETELAAACVPGLTLRSGPTGALWDLELSLPAKAGSSSEPALERDRRVHITLGPYPDLSPESARDLANWHLVRAVSDFDGSMITIGD